MKRILHILPQFQPGGGMERVVMNYHAVIDHSHYQFDILTHKIENDIYAKKICHDGGNVYVFPEINIHTIRNISAQYDSLLKKRQYDVVHCHMANAAFIYLRYAKKNNIPIRILHSHQNRYADSLTHTLRNIPLVYLGKRYANCNVACSELAGRFLFGKQKFTLLPNGIDVNRFSYSQRKREIFRKKLNIENDAIVFGIVGRLVSQKNLYFGIQVFFECKRYFMNARLIIAGDGELKNDLKEYAKSIGIEKDITWLGNRSDIDVVDSGIDILLMPSIYEGLGLSIIEAQSSGVECFASDKFPPESNSSDFFHEISLTCTSNEWAKHIYSVFKNRTLNRSLGALQVRAHGFDISDAGQILETIYME